MPRKFYKTVYEIEVLSEEKIPEWMSVEEIAYEITSGGCSAVFNHIKTQELTGKECAEELMNQGSDPEFFQIDENGNELGDDDADI